MIPAALKRWLPHPRWGVIAVPYLWLLLFFAIPFLIVLKISFSTLAIAMPPYTPVLEFVDSAVMLRLNLSNYLALAMDSQYVEAYASSIKIAGISTLLALLVAYPMAYVIARLSPSSRNIALMLVILPSWTSFLIRVYAWIGILKNNGLINNLLMGLGSHRRAPEDSVHPDCRLHRHRLYLSAVHGLAALHQSGQTRSASA